MHFLTMRREARVDALSAVDVGGTTVDVGGTLDGGSPEIAFSVASAPAFDAAAISDSSAT